MSDPNASSSGFLSENEGGRGGNSEGVLEFVRVRAAAEEKKTLLFSRDVLSSPDLGIASAYVIQAFLRSLQASYSK